MVDVFDALVGQDRAIAALRQHVKNPVHAYLISGPVGSSLHDAALALAAGLQCAHGGCGECDACRLVLSGNDTDVNWVARAGLSWRIDELREADRVARRRPLGDGYQIVVIEEVELTTTGSSPSAPALLKSLEEPPSRTIFILTAEDVPEALATIESRCVEVTLRGLGATDLEEILRREGAPAILARAAAHAANGNLRRARVLVGDEALADRITAWRSVPDRLNGTPATSAAIAQEISRALDEAIAPLARLQEEELARLGADARELGQRSVANRKEIEARYKREQRRFRIDELRFGLASLTGVYRDRLAASLDEANEGDSRAGYRVGASINAIEVIAGANRRLGSNADETLLLNDLMLSLMAF